MSGFDNLVSALAFLALGVVELALVQRFVYPLLRQRHEAAKVRASQGADPNRIMTIVRFQSLLVMPAIGFVLGGRLRALIG